MENYQVTQGAALAIEVTLRDSTGAVVTDYDGSQALSTTVWIGRDQAASFTAATTWTNPGEGTIGISIATAQTAALTPGRYEALTRLDDSGVTVDVFAFWLEVTYAPGSAAALTSYGSFADMLDRAPWIEKLQRPTDLAGFARQRYLARRWFETLLHRHYRGGSGISTDFHFVPGLSFAGRFGDALYRDGRRSAELQGWLDADRLDVTEDVIEAVTCYAIAMLCDRQIAPGKDDSGYAAAARKWFGRAEDAASNISAEIDSDGDSVNDTTIRLGLADTLEG